MERFKKFFLILSIILAMAFQHFLLLMLVILSLMIQTGEVRIGIVRIGIARIGAIQVMITTHMVERQALIPMVLVFLLLL